MNARDDPPSSGPAHPDLLFVYGTLRRGCMGEPARRLAGESDWLGMAHVQGRLYRIGGYPGLRMSEQDNGPDSWPGWGTVTGDLIRLHNPAITLDWLDAYEEVGGAFPEPWEYRRVVTAVTVAGDEQPITTPAWTYVYNWPVDGLEHIAGGNWLTE